MREGLGAGQRLQLPMSLPTRTATIVTAIAVETDIVGGVMPVGVGPGGQDLAHGELRHPDTFCDLALRQSLIRPTGRSRLGCRR